MINLAEAIGRALMTAVNQPRSNYNDGLKRYCEIEFGKDSKRIYESLTRID